MRNYLNPMPVMITLICLVVMSAGLHGQQTPTPPPAGSEGTGNTPGAELKAAVEDEFKEDLHFQPPTVPTLQKGKFFRFSLCTGSFISTDGAEPRCMQTTSTTVHGGHVADYVFSLPAGERLPEGLQLDGHGILSGTPRQTLTKMSFQVCVRQLNEDPACETVAIKGNEIEQSTQTKPSHIGRKLAIAGGAAALGVGAAAALASKAGGGSNCSNLGNQCTNLSNQCLNGVSSACSQVNGACSQFCSCQGLSGFNVNTGTCQ